jgi:protein-S-isoprenylcysteine O-methyltransferase Ste14
MGARAYEGFYRLLYNAFAVLTFLPVLYLLATQVSDTLLWTIPVPIVYLAYLIQIIGFIGLGVTLLQRGLWQFAGLRQALDFLGNRGRSIPPPRLVTNGVYALVRHPLYFFGMLVLWFNPEMTFNVFVFNVMATIYFWVGSHYEEQRLEALFGEVYQEYRRNVPALLPLKLRS